MLPEGFEFRSHSAQGHGVLRSDALSDVRELSHGFGPLVRLGLYCPGRHPDRALALHHQVPLPRHERLGRCRCGCSADARQAQDDARRFGGGCLRRLRLLHFLRCRRLDAALRRSLRRHDGSRIAHNDLLLLHRLARLRIRLCLPSEEQGALRLGHDAQRPHRLRRICGSVPLPLALRVHGRRFPDRLLSRGRDSAARRGCDGGILP